MIAPRTAPADKPLSRIRKEPPAPTPPREITITVPERTGHVDRAE
jgi:hypothetical protein